MRRLLVTGIALAALASTGVANATAPPDSTAPAESAAGTAAADTVDTENVPATIFDESGEPLATVTLIGAQTEWADYEDGAEPDEGNEYVQVVVEVTSAVAEDTFGVAVGDFILQDQNGFVTGAETVRSAAQAEADEEIVDEADLGNAESIQLALTFQVETGVGPQSVFYRPDDERLVDIAELG